MRTSILIVFAFLTLAGCTSSLVSHTLPADECRILAKKRVVAKRGKQPRLNPNYSMRTESPNSPARPLPKVTSDLIIFHDAKNAPDMYAGIGPVIPEDPVITRRVTKMIDEKSEAIENTSLQRADVVTAPPRIRSNIAAPVTPINWSIPAMIAAAVLCSMALLTAFAPSFMRVSAWAARHPVGARVAIAGIHTVTIGGAMLTGIDLANQGDRLPVSVMGMAGAVVVTGFLAYPNAVFSLANFTNNFLRRKICEMLVFAGGTAMVFTGANLMTHTATDTQRYQNTFQQTEQRAQLVPAYKANNTITVETVKARDPDPPRGKRTGLKIVTIILFVAAILGVAGLSCAIACAGHELLALLVFIGGEAGLIIAMISILRSLSGKKRAKRPRTVQPVPAGT